MLERKQALPIGILLTSLLSANRDDIFVHNRLTQEIEGFILGGFYICKVLLLLAFEAQLGLSSFYETC